MSDVLKNSRILIIDDAMTTLEMTASALQEAGVEDVLLAEDGLEGFEMTVEYAPDLVIADLMMPRVDGFEYCRLIREKERFRELPVIIQTSMTDPKKRGEAFRCGATDVLLKPVSAEELLARVQVHIERVKLVMELRAYRSRVEEELEQARRMQEGMLPSEEYLEKVMEGNPITASSLFLPSEMLSGDFWGIHALSKNQLAFYLVDFTGHGLLAALNTFRMHTLINSDYVPSVDPGGYLTQLNAVLYPLLPSNHFATMFYGVFDIVERKLHFASAASPSPFLFRADGSVSPLVLNGLPLSVRRETSYRTVTVDVAPGDTLFCFSDALIEVETAKGTYFDMDCLLENCKQLGMEQKEKLSHDPALITRHATALLKTASGGASVLADDLTLLALGFAA